MALNEMGPFTTDFTTWADKPNKTAAEIKSALNSHGNDIKTYINDTLLPALSSTADGSSGADQIGATSISGLTGNTVQALLEAIKGASDAHLAETAPQSNVHNIANSAAINLYVDTATGDDNNDGSDYAHAFKTIKKATDTLSQLIILQPANIYIKAGTYAEGILLKNLVGLSPISFKADGGDVVLTGEADIGSMIAIAISNFTGCLVRFDEGSGVFKIQPSAAFGTVFYSLYADSNVSIYGKFNINGSTWPGGITSKNGISISKCVKMRLKNGTDISNCTNALIAGGLGEIVTEEATGSGNSVAYTVNNGGKIFISATSGAGHISGTTQKFRVTGGLIVDPNGLIT